jgi:hypothetical protein
LFASEKRVEQQFLGGEIVGSGDDDRAQFDDRVVVPARPERRANRLVGLGRQLMSGPACNVGHRHPT